MTLESLLHTTFGFSGFRANQEAVCRAATEGRDVLLVMPTGAGKSLCYQLPALARGGPALVISPLIALMEDQSSKLSRLGLKVARIHSGIPREYSRQACRDYLDGTLQFLFIAPERMRVPGFPQMLAKRTPSLVAIDEAHCISAWGHDFRPDYRTLGEHLPALRPAPIVALTATATPTVQRDIAAQLRLADPAFFIHGFRRSNLAIEVVEMSKPRRSGFTAELLKDEGRRPAIVYAPSRKAAEDLAGELARRFPAAAYHAGLDPGTRERVQTAFLEGKLDVVVATIAFGMGIDKADVRTVIHTALPASVEAYYQEIGRAGRDGLPSRTVLLHSYADRKMHEFFLERDYPPATDLARVARVLDDDFLMPEPLARELKMDPYHFQKAIEKLVAQGAASIDVAGNVRRVSAGMTARGSASWQSGYEAQLAFRRAQLDAIAGYAETAQCRMSALVRHFGDTADGMRPCGHCDVCAPASTHAQQFRAPSDSEARTLRAILGALQHVPSRAAGRLHSDLGQGMERREFDGLLDALARAALVTISSETFQAPDGKTVPYKKVALTHDGRHEDASELADVLVADHTEQDSLRSSGSERMGKRRRGQSARKPDRTGTRSEEVIALTPEQQVVEEALRGWRKAEAAKTGKPAFLVFGDAVLRSIAAAQPRTISELLGVSGVGQTKSETYGAAVLSICSTGQVIGRPVVAKAEKERSSGPAVSAPRPKKIQVDALEPELPRKVSTSRAPGLRAQLPPEPRQEANYTPDQQALDLRLRDWRKAESERLGLPQFFVLASSTLRGIVIARPKSVNELGAIPGVDPEKLRQFGSKIVELCSG
jgi:ATP-dependent DNA helicase RecQ